MGNNRKNISLRDQLNGIELIEKKVAMAKSNLLYKAVESTDPNVLYKASNMVQNVDNREPSTRKSFVFDPNDFNNFMGYKDKPVALSYSVLRRISYAVPVIRAVIGTRIDQICSFCAPQQDKYSTGFVVRKKRGWYETGDAKMSKSELKEASRLTDFIMNCGGHNSLEADDFDEFTRKVFNDSLTFDQMTFEIVNDRRGLPYELFAVDGSSIRKADSYDDDYYKKQLDQGKALQLNRKKIKGYYPSYCQIDNGVVTSDFYPWEMCFGIRNPTTNIYSAGYGVSEIEVLINTVTSILWADEYNRRFFSQGSAPKGLLKVKSGSGMNSTTLQDFKQKWQSMMAGVYNSWRTPILEADVDWVDLQKTNRDMEFSSWYEFLIKIVCAIFKIDPAEINFPLPGGAEQKSLFEGNNEARLKHSKDKGLAPMLRFYERKLNKFVIQRLNPEYELVFKGLDVDGPGVELDMDIKKVQNFMTVDEIRERQNLPPLGPENGGNIVLNSVWMQNSQAQQQMEFQAQQQQMQGMQGGMDGEAGGEEQMQGEDDPFAKAFDSYFKKSVLGEGERERIVYNGKRTSKKKSRA